MHCSLGLVARRVVGAGAALLLTAALAGPATASAWEVTFPAGLACDGFDLVVAGEGLGTGITQREVKDGLVISAGTGDALTFTNGTTQASLSFQSNGAGSFTRPGPGSLTTVTSIGHTVVIMFATDNPPGPSTTLYVGRVVYTIDTFGSYTLVRTAGTATDICAALD